MLRPRLYRLKSPYRSTLLAVAAAIVAACGTSPEDAPSTTAALQSTPTAGTGLQADYYIVAPLTSVTSLDFSALTPVRTETVPSVHHNVGGGPLWPGGPADLFAVRYAGQFHAPSSGLYTFYLNSDDGSALFIDGQRVILNDGVRPAVELQTTLSLAHGAHQIELHYFERYGLSVIELDWSGPHTAGRQTAYFGPTAETGLRAEYFAGVTGRSLSQVDFTVPPTYVETVRAIDKSAGAGTGFWVTGPTNTFAARYRGVFTVDAPGNHEFHVLSDDGAALYIDGQLVVNNDGVHPPRAMDGTVNLATGDHAIELRYFEHFGGADLQLAWTPPGGSRNIMRFGPQDGLRARYFALTAPSVSALSQVDFTATPDVTERVATIDRNVGTGAFWAGGPVNRFAAQYAGQFYVGRAGTHRFFVSNDDGAAVYVDGQLLLLNDGVHPETTVDASIELYEGVHDIEVRYFENGGLASVIVEWQGPSTLGRETMRFRAPPERGLLVDFFVVPDTLSLDDVDFTAAPASQARTEFVDFNAGGGAMWTGGPNDRFAARISGTVEVQNGGDYTFYLVSDDGAALYLDGEMIIDHDGLHGASERSHTLQVQSGLHDIEVRYFERTGLAAVRLDWAGPGTTGRERVYFGPQERDVNFRADYYATAGGITDLDQVTFDGQPDGIDFLDFIDLDDSGGAFWPGGPVNNFAARFTGTLPINAAGNYAFYLTGDDGCELWIDGSRVIDNDGVHGPIEVGASVNLTSGPHAIEVRYFEAGGGARLVLEWAGPDSPARGLLFLGDAASGDNRPRPDDVVSTFTLPEDAPSVPLALPLFDADGDPLTIDVVSAADAGTVRRAGNLVVYTPAPGFEGRDAFRYAASDASGQITNGFVQLDVFASHQQPVHTINPAIAAELTPSGQFLLVRQVATVPDSITGAKARMNAVIAHDGRLYVSVEGNATGESAVYSLTPNGNGSYTTALWFDIGAAVVAATGRQINNANVAHGGLRSLAFHPDFASNGRIFTSVMEDRPANPAAYTYLSDASNPIGADSVLIEWTVVNGQVDPTSYREVFRIGMPVFDHPIKQIGFNPYAIPGDPDYGLLYVAHGDGSVQSATAGGGQNNDALGKMIRVDPLQNGSQPFRIPPNNPFVGDPTMLDAVYATGFRNPHNFSFNRAGAAVALINTGVGRNNFDEVNIVMAGANYGWSEREGPMVHNTSGGGLVVGVDNLPGNEASFGFTYPATFYGHYGNIGQSFGGKALAGAFAIDNGSELDGEFIFGNFGSPGRLLHAPLSDLLAADTQVTSGEVVSDALSWVTPSELIVLVDHDQDASTTPVVHRTFPTAIGQGRSDFRFGRGLHGELVIVNKRDGKVYVAVNTLPPTHPQFQSTAAFR